MSASDFSNWYSKVYPELSGAGLWLRGGEINALPSGEWDRRCLRVLIVRLSTYLDTIDSSTHGLLYALLAGTKDVYPDLAFLPPAKDGEVMVRDGVPWLLGTQSKRPASEFDIIAVSNSIVQELINLPTILKRSGIPVGRASRIKDENVPLVILGGANALHSSVAWIGDAMVDGVFAGSNTRCILRLFKECSTAKKIGKGKVGMLSAMVRVPGFFATGEDTGHRTRQVPGDFGVNATRLPLFFGDPSSLQARLAISEGCSCLCSFCAESYGRKPYAEAGVREIVDRARKMKAAMGVDSVELQSFNFNMHSGLRGLLSGVSGVFGDIGLKSQRLDLFARDPQLALWMHAAGKASITCGIEGISTRMRKYFHKNLGDDDIAEGLRFALSSPIRELKVFLVASGLENDSDLAELSNMAGYIREQASYAKARPRIIVSVTPLVRFSCTPLEFEDAPSMSQVKQVVGRMSSVVQKERLEFRVAASPAEYSVSQVLARCREPAVARALVRAVETSGFVYYRQVQDSFVDALRGSISSEGVDPDSMLKGIPFHEAATTPWAGINTGVKREFLIQQWKMATKFHERDACVDGPGEGCSRCGGCPGVRAKGGGTNKVVDGGDLLIRFREAMALARKPQAVVSFRVVLDDRARGVVGCYTSAALAKALMMAEEGLVTCFRGSVPEGEDDDGLAWCTGVTRVSLKWSESGAEHVRKLVAAKSFMQKVNCVLAGWGVLEGEWSNRTPECIYEFRSPYAFDCSVYCRRRGLKYTSYKGGPLEEELRLSPDSIKKRIVSAVTVLTERDGRRVILVNAAAKFVVGDFMKECFTLSTACDWVRTRVFRR